jgi:uncharacterized protein YdhG (YjbR/CyaY superfamily)
MRTNGEPATVDEYIATFPRDMQDILSKYELRFSIDRPMPLGLIEKIVEFRVNEAQGKSAVKKGKK